MVNGFVQRKVMMQDRLRGGLLKIVNAVLGIVIVVPVVIMKIHQKVHQHLKMQCTNATIFCPGVLELWNMQQQISTMYQIISCVSRDSWCLWL